MAGKSTKSFITLKKEALQDAKAEFAAQGRPVPKGYVPEIDQWQIPQFRDADERKAMEANPTPGYLRLKKRREARDTAEEEAVKESRRRAQEEEDNKEAAWQAERAKHKADRERDAKEREERMKSQRENAALARAGNKRNRDNGDADSQATQREQGTSDTKAESGLVVVGGARLFHGTARWRPMVVDSDDEAEMLPKAKRARTARGEVAIVVHADSSSRKRKRDEDSEGSDNEPLDMKMKRRRFETVRPESNKENLGRDKRAEAVKKANAVKAKAERPAALGGKTKMSEKAGISKTKAAKKPTKRVQVAKDEPAKAAPEKKQTQPIPSHRVIRSLDDPFGPASSGDARRARPTQLTQKMRRSSSATVGSASKSARTEDEMLQSAIFGRRW